VTRRARSCAPFRRRAALWVVAFGAAVFLAATAVGTTHASEQSVRSSLVEARAAVASRPSLAQPAPSPSPSPWRVPYDQLLPQPTPSASPTTPSPWGNPPLDEPIPAEPTPSQPPPLPSGDGDDDPAWWDVGGRVRKAIDDWFRRVVESALNPMLTLVGRTLLATPDVSGDPRVRQLWASTQVLANTVFVLFVLAGGAG
jgi:hypothetical protein